MLQNKWLEVRGLSEGRLADAVSKRNPAVALSDALHKRVNKAQIKLGLHDSSYLRTLEAEQIIELNARAMRAAGVPEHVIQTLQKEALEYASGLPRAR